MVQGINQQETHSDLIWLCGFLDGEGCFCLHRRSPWQQQKQLTFQPEVVFTNCHIPSLERVSAILKTYGVGSYFTKPNPTNMRKHLEWKPARRIIVLGIQRVEKFLSFAMPYIFTKREQAQVLQDFITLRKPKDTRDVYGTDEWALVEKLRVLNKRGSSETIRVPLQSDDIVQAQLKTWG